MAILCLPDRLLRNDGRVYVRLQIVDHLLLLDCVLDDLLLDLLRLDANLEHFVDHLLQVLHHVVVLRLEVLVSLVDYAHEHFAVVLKSSSQRLQIVVHLKKTPCYQRQDAY